MSTLAREVTVVVVDDHPLYREGLVMALESMPGVAVVGEAGDGESAVDVVRRTAPTVVLMDLHMPGMNGIDATRRLLENDPDIAVLVLTMLEGDDSVFAAMRAGARGYLLKGADRAEIARALARWRTARWCSAPRSPSGCWPSSGRARGRRPSRSRS